MFIRRKKSKVVPMLNTSSLPDLIFSVLFFFMIVTHMRQSVPQVMYDVPRGEKLSELTKSEVKVYIYVGQKLNLLGKDNNNPMVIQMSDRLINSPAYINAELQRLKRMKKIKDSQPVSVVIRADKNAPMSMIKEIKEELRKAKVNKISFSAVKK